MDPGALGKELPAGNPLETAISRKQAPTNELTMLAGQPMETKNSKKQELAKELMMLADELLKETLVATYARLRAKFEEIVAVEKQYSPGKVMAPIEDEDMAPQRDGIPR